jgi:hypothetical protein
MEVNICLVISVCFFESKAFYTKPRVSILRNRMVFLNRKNQHLLEVTHSLMLDTQVPKSYWGDALLIATYLINKMPFQVLDFKTPLEVLSPPLSASKGVS